MASKSSLEGEIKNDAAEAPYPCSKTSHTWLFERVCPVKNPSPSEGTNTAAGVGS